MRPPLQRIWGKIPERDLELVLRLLAKIEIATHQPSASFTTDVA
jgi:hypothetical protein